MKTYLVQYILLALWLCGFLICASVALSALPYFMPGSDTFGELFNNILDTYSPQVATMLAFLFSDRVTQKKKRMASKSVSILALALSLIYVAFFSGLMIVYRMNVFSLTASDVVSLFELIRPKSSFLVTASLAYFFATRE